MSARAMPRLGGGVWAILALALVLRLAAAAWLSSELPTGADERAYTATAGSIAAGDGWPPRPFVNPEQPSALVPPAYAYLLGALEALGAGTGTERAVQAVLGTATVALIGLVAWLVFRRRAVTVAALAIAAAYPPLIVIGAPLMTESLFLPLMLGAVAATLRQREVGGVRWAAAAGALAGLAAMTKTVGLVALGVLVVAMWGRPWLSRGRLAAPAVALVVGLAVLTPWSLRNSFAFDGPSGAAHELGFGLAGAYNEAVRADPDHEWVPPVTPEFRELLLDPGLNEAQVSRELTSRALEFALDHPTLPLAVALHNALRLVQWHPASPSATDAELFGFGVDSAKLGAFRVAWWASAAGFLVIAALALAAVLRGDARAVPPFVWVLALLAVLPLVAIAAGPRLRLPADALLIVVAAPGAVRLARAARRPTGCSRG